MTSLYLPHLPIDVTIAPTRVLSARVGAAGNCSDECSDDWFPPEPVGSAEAARTRYEQLARQLCAGCPVQAECLELALRYEAQPRVKRHGVWGGTAPWVRQRLHRARVRRAAILREAVPA